MRGTPHDTEAVDLGVWVSNADDPHCNMILETPEELEAFIAALREAGRKAFGGKAP